MRMIPIVICFCLVICAKSSAHHPDGIEPNPAFAVVAQIPATPEELSRLLQHHLVLGYLWRGQIATILADRRFLGQEAVVDLEASKRLRGESNGLANFPCYRTVEETQSDLLALAELQPELASWVDYGDSWEKTQGNDGYDLGALVLTNSTNSGVNGEPKPVLMIMAAMHARELTTAETATRFAEFLINGYGIDPDITWVLDHTEIHILPQQNPDGRKQAETGLLWRKNTNENYCPQRVGSRGADLNRNASTIFWGQGSSTSDECRDTFRGPTPASEPETDALERYQASVFPDQRDGDIGTGAPVEATGLFISLHSYGEFIFYPWEGSDADTGNENGYRSLAQRLGSLTGYAACQNCCLPTAAGTAVDFAYETFGVASLTFELGTTFFEQCESFEQQIWPDNRRALLYAAKAARRPYLSSHGPVVEGISVSVDENSETAVISATVEDGAYAVNNPCPPADAVQPSEPIAAVRYTVTAPPWKTKGTVLDPADGAFDTTTETATGTLTLSELGTGRQLVFVQAEDAVGNLGPPSAVFVQIPIVFADGFEESVSDRSPAAHGAAAP